MDSEGKRITASKMVFMRLMVTFTPMDCRRNEGILKELKMEAVLGKILKHESNWSQLVNRMQKEKFPKLQNITNHGG